MSAPFLESKVALFAEIPSVLILTILKVFGLIMGPRVHPFTTPLSQILRGVVIGLRKVRINRVATRRFSSVN